MKYCKKCGMLLEDTAELCIGCGLDATKPENISMYPPTMQKKMEAEKKENKTRKKTILVIIILFVLLIALVCAIIFLISPAIERAAAEQAQLEEDDDDFEDEIEEIEEEAPAEDDTAGDANRVVKDDEGLYYAKASIQDVGGNEIFTGLYPEDFVITTSVVDYSLYSNRFPGRVTFVVGNSDDTVHFTYLSPQQFWHKKSENKETRKNERDITYYMSFLSYDGAKGYVEALLNQSYAKAKKITQVETTEAPLATKDKLKDLSAAFKREMQGDIGDYAHVGADTTYAVMESEFSCEIYRYEVVTKENNTLFLKFYVPVIANNLYYSSTEANDRGMMTEWIALGVYCMEAGNEDLYDDFAPAFDVFMDNCNVNRRFFSLMEQYGETIRAAVSQYEEPQPLEAGLLSSFRTEGYTLNAFDEALCNFVTIRYGGTQFSYEDFLVNGAADIAVAFVDPEKNKVFLSPVADEYPGGGFLDMSMGLPGENQSQAADSSAEDDLAVDLSPDADEVTEYAEDEVNEFEVDGEDEATF